MLGAPAAAKLPRYLLDVRFDFSGTAQQSPARSPNTVDNKKEFMGNILRTGVRFFPAILVMVLAVSCSTPEKKTTIVLTTGAARNVTRLTQTPQDETFPSVSPDGRIVAFQVFKDGQYDIWTIDGATGRNLIQVTSHTSNDLLPAWTPDSRSLVFASDRLGSLALWRQLASGGGGTTMITKGADMSDFAPTV